MKKLLLILLFPVGLTCVAQDSPRCINAEPPYINHMPGFYISDCRNSDYNDAEFVYYSNSKAFKINKGGKYYSISYRKKEGEGSKQSSDQIIRNYYNAILKIKGKALDDKKSMLTASVDGKDVFIKLHTAANSADAGSYRVEVLEVAQMEQNIVINLDEAIEKDGKAVIYGILFDTGKSDVKPESAKALQQVTDFLNSNPSIRIIVVGHTDNAGNFANNILLSKARAESIKNYLVNISKISIDRLMAEGVGSLCPVSANSTEEGKQLNRRVEIVKQ